MKKEDMIDENTQCALDPVPYMVHESEMAILERSIRRLWVLCIIIFVAFVASNICWIAYENSFEDVEITATQETPNGNNNFIGHDGDITNGEANSESQDKTP